MKLQFVSIMAMLSAAVTAQVPDDVSLTPVPGISGLNAPLGLKHAGDGSGRIFIVEQGGTIRIIDAAGSLLTARFVTLGNQVEDSGERGLLDVAFHPEFDTNGLFYLHYSAGSDRPPGTSLGDTIVAEFSVTSDPDIASNSPERIVLTIAQDFANHNGGQMRFGPDGYLYLGLGDGGSGGDPCNRAQTLDPADIQTGSGCRSQASVALLGKMLRIDVDNPTPAGDNNLCAAAGDGSAGYSIPADNPFSGMPNRCGEVLHSGLRNPWRWSFDRANGDIWIGDVGQNTWEEIDLLQAPNNAAENFGWRPCEGSFERNSTSTPCQLAGSIPPVIEYQNQGSRCSVTGGYRYRGPISSLRGRYIYGDFCSGEIWFGDNDSGSWQTTLTGFSVGNIRSFGEDEQGNVYVIAGNDLFRFEGDTNLIFADGFETP